MVASPRAIRRRPARGPFVFIAVVAIAIVFAGFARTFYLKGLFGTPVLPLILHAHGLVMSTWFVLFLVQAWLVSSGNVRVHMRLGVLGALLAATIVVLNTTVAIRAAALGHTPPGGPPPLVFLAVPLFDIAVFAILVGTALAFRHRRSDVHKRLMLLAVVSLLTAAVARIPLTFLHARIVVDFSLMILLVLVCVAWDTIRHRRLHPAMAWGALLVIVSVPLRMAVAGSAGWLAFAHWLTH
jgi:hypothetical protein